MQVPEKRQCKRIKRPFTTQIRPFQNNEEKDLSAKWDIVTMKDLSAEGMCFNYTKRLPVGTIIEFKIALPFTPEPIYCIGEVSRIDEAQISDIKSPQIPVYKIAIRFTQIDLFKKEAILKYIKRF